MNRALVALLVLCGLYGAASAQPVPVTWRPPVGTVTGEYLKWNGTRWVASGVAPSSLTNSAGNNVMVKSNGTNLIPSSVTDDGTTWAVASNKVTITEANGNTGIAGTLGVQSNTTLGLTTANTLTVNGATTINGPANAFPLNVEGRDGATSNIVLRLSSKTSGSATAISLSDGFTYNFGIATAATSGDLVFLSSLFAGAAGTERMRIAQGGAVTIPGTLGVTGLSTLTGGVTTPANLTTTGTGALIVAGAGTVAGLVRLGAAVTTETYISNHTINFNYGDNATSTGYINYTGYNGGTTQFRNLVIADGKSATACSVTGSTKTLDCSVLTEGGAAVLSGTISSNTVPRGSSGNLVDSSIVDNGSTVSFLSGSAYFAAGRQLNFDSANNATTDGAINYTGYAGGITQFRDLGIYDGKNGTILYMTGSTKAAVFSGAVTANTTLNVTTNTTLGAATTATTTVNGRFTSSDTPAAATADRFATNITAGGTYDATIAVRNAYAVVATANATRSAGAFGVTNTALYGTASGAQTNYALFTDSGDIKLVSTSGTVGIGVAPGTPKLTVGGDTTVNGNSILGSTSANTTTINGKITATAFPTNTTDVTFTDSNTLRTSGTLAAFSMSGSVDNNAANRAVSGLTISVAPTATNNLLELDRTALNVSAASGGGAGSADVTTAIAASATGGATNYAIHATAGNIVADAAVNTILGGTLNVTGATTLANTTIGSSQANSATLWGQTIFKGTAPTISACGTTPSVGGDDMAGTVTMGSGTATSCTVTFATAATTNAPACVITSQMATRGDLLISAQSTSAFTITNVAGVNMASGKFNYFCPRWL